MKPAVAVEDQRAAGSIGAGRGHSRWTRLGSPARNLRGFGSRAGLETFGKGGSCEQSVALLDELVVPSRCRWSPEFGGSMSKRCEGRERRLENGGSAAVS
jgi:hypothetical protein